MDPTRLVLFLLAFLCSFPAFAVTPPSVDSPTITSASNPKDAAVVIGNEDYVFLPDVLYAMRDAQAFNDWLVRSRGIPAARVRFLPNASHATIRNAIVAAAAEVQSGGILWVYFAGHGVGVVRPDGKTTERALVGKSAEADAGTLDEFVIRLSDIEDIVAGSLAARSVLVFDACYVNADRAGNPLLGGRFVVPNYIVAPPAKVVMWTGASSTEVAESYDAAQHGLFTYFVLAGLQGQADGVAEPADGQVTLDEAATWTSQAVRIVGEFRQNPILDATTADRSTVLVRAPLMPSAIDLASFPKARVVAGADALKAELERLRQEQEARRIEDGRQAANHEQKLEAARHEVLEQATAAYRDVEALAHEPGDVAELAVRRFLEVYEGATVTVDGVPTPVEIPEVAGARALLDDLQRRARRTPSQKNAGGSHVSRGLAIGAGVSALASVVSFALAHMYNDTYVDTDDPSIARSALNTNHALFIGGTVTGATTTGLLAGAVVTGKW